MHVDYSKISKKLSKSMLVAMVTNGFLTKFKMRIYASNFFCIFFKFVFLIIMLLLILLLLFQKKVFLIYFQNQTSYV